MQKSEVNSLFNDDSLKKSCFDQGVVLKETHSALGNFGFNNYKGKRVVRTGYWSKNDLPCKFFE